jgi:DNA-binding NarL/FixJ family response regulator
VVSKFSSDWEQFRSIRPEREGSLSVILSTSDHLWRQALKAVLEKEQIVIVGEPSGEEETVRLIERSHPKVAIIDSFVAFHGETNSLDRMVRAHKPTRIILVVAKPIHNLVMEAIEAGVAACIAKSDCSELLTTLHRNPEPFLYLSPTVVQALAVGSASQDETLSRREREVLQLIAKGRTSKQIAPHLGISTKTVESHVTRVKKKLNLRETAGLVRYVLDDDLARGR